MILHDELSTLEQIELVGPRDGGDWKVENRWFVMQSGLLVRLKRRSQQNGKVGH